MLFAQADGLLERNAARYGADPQLFLQDKLFDDHQTLFQDREHPRVPLLSRGRRRVDHTPDFHTLDHNIVALEQGLDDLVALRNRRMNDRPSSLHYAFFNANSFGYDGNYGFMLGFAAQVGQDLSLLCKPLVKARLTASGSPP